MNTEKFKIEVTMVDDMVKALKAGSKVVLHDVGYFIVKDRAARVGRNPKTGEAVQVAAKKVISFKPCKGLKEKVV